MKEKLQLSSKAPFMGAVVFFALLFWVQRSVSLNLAGEGLNFRFMTMAIYGFLGLGAAVYGVYLQKTGKKTIPGPRMIQMIWSIIAVAVVTAVALVIGASWMDSF